MKIIILFLALFLNAKAPEFRSIAILQDESIKVFDPVLNAFQCVESNYRSDVVNSLGYTGMLQIGQEMTDEANRINKMTGNPVRFTFPQCALDSLQSVQVWYIVQGWHNPKSDLKRAACIWNPLASNKYYLKLQKAL